MQVPSTRNCGLPVSVSGPLISSAWKRATCSTRVTTYSPSSAGWPDSENRRPGISVRTELWKRAVREAARCSSRRTFARRSPSFGMTYPPGYS